MQGEVTLPWPGSFTTGGEPILSTDALALNVDIWPMLGVSPLPATLSHVPGSGAATLQVLDSGDRLHSLQLGDHPSSTSELVGGSPC